MSTQGTKSGGRIYFSFLGVPVTIHPFSWILLALLGGGFGIDSAGDVTPVLLFVVAGMLSLLVHEYGHALAGRALNGGPAFIEIAGMGGVTRFPMMRSSRWEHFGMVAAGPLAGIALGLFGGLVLGIMLGDLGLGLKAFVALPLNSFGITWISAQDIVVAAIASGVNQVIFIFFIQLFFVSFWWSVFNLLPIFPMDGGQLLGTILNNFRLASMIGLVLASLGALSLLILAPSMWITAAILGYIAYINLNYFKAASPN